MMWLQSPDFRSMATALAGRVHSLARRLVREAGTIILARSPGFRSMGTGLNGSGRSLARNLKPRRGPAHIIPEPSPGYPLMGMGSVESGHLPVRNSPVSLFRQKYWFAGVALADSLGLFIVRGNFRNTEDGRFYSDRPHWSLSLRLGSEIMMFLMTLFRNLFGYWPNWKGVILFPVRVPDRRWKLSRDSSLS